MLRLFQEMASEDMKDLRAKYTQEAINEHQMAKVEGVCSDLFSCEKCGGNNCTYNQVIQRLDSVHMVPYSPLLWEHLIFSFSQDFYIFFHFVSKPVSVVCSLICFGFYSLFYSFRAENDLQRPVVNFLSTPRIKIKKKKKLGLPHVRFDWITVRFIDC